MMHKLLQNKAALALLCAGAALLFLLIGALSGALPLLFALLSLAVMIPLKDYLSYGVAAWLAVSAASLFLPGGKDSALIFALFGYYPLVRDRIARCESRALRSGLRLVIILLTAAALFSVTVLFFAEQLPSELSGSLGLLLAVYLIVTAIYFLIFDFALKKLSEAYDGLKHHQADTTI